MSLIVSINLDDVASQIKRAASESVSEEDLRIRVESILRGLVLEPLGIPWGRYEYAPKKYSTLVSGVRIDALHSHVVVEYEKPGSFEQKSNYEHAIQQVKDGILGHAQGVTDRLPRYFGVALDGTKIGFVRYRQRLKDFEANREPLEVDRRTVARLIEAIQGLKRKALDAEELLKDFGPNSELSKKVIGVFYDKLNERMTGRTSILFGNWRRVFSQVCAYDPEKLKGLEEQYGFKKGEADVERLLFSLHSYFALLMKLLAAEVASLYWHVMGSYLKALEDAYYKGPDRFKDQLRELEEGGFFSKFGISNFLEGDYFAWYLDEWDATLADTIASLVRKLSDYDPSTAELEPDKIKDLFKRLYQNLVPKKVRHDLGEYYTPDWLAELVLNEVGYTLENFNKLREEKNDALAPLDLRVLDPACGSGTFLILAIRRLREYIDEHWIDKGSALRRIVKNVVGFDLNPLAVMASRANYLISIGDMLREKGAEQIEIPIYLADSIMVEQRTTVLGTRAYLLRTVAGNFEVPISIVERGILSKVLDIMKECVKLNYTPNEFMGRLEREIDVKEEDTETLKGLYETISKLEKEGKNKIWLGILKNSFAPFLLGRFNYVVGNPPWVNWESLPSDYRKSSADLWTDYGLVLAKGAEAGLGAKKRDISMLFVYRCADRYLMLNSPLGFVMTQSVFKSDAGEGFRRFAFGESHLCVRTVHDMVELTPFEGAQNRTSVLILEKGKRTTYPVPYIIWHKTGRDILTDWSLNEVVSNTSTLEYVANPVDQATETSAWICLSEKAHYALRQVVGRSDYTAYEGCNTGGMNGVFFVKILSKLQQGLVLIENLVDVGKKKVRRVQQAVEPDLVYPLLRGRDVDRWIAAPSAYEVVTGDLGVSREGIGVTESEMKTRYPRTYSYLKEFEKELRERPLYKNYRSNSPFYNIFNVSKRTLTPYKVVWRYIASSLTAAVVEPIKDEHLGERVVIPDHRLMLVPCNNKEEAHFICAVLNSSLARLVAKSYAVETQISTHVLEHVRVPRYDPNDNIHVKVSNLSKEAHQLARQGREDELKKVEDEIDEVVAKLYGVTDAELKDIQKALRLLQGEEVEEEEAEAIPTLEPDITLRNNVPQENTPFNLEIVIQNPSDQPLSNVKIKAELLGRSIERLFEGIKGEETVLLRLQGLKKGQYKVKLVMDYISEGAKKRLEKELSIFVKGSEEIKTIERGSAGKRGEC